MFDAAMLAVVRQFQSCHPDADGNPLVVDGAVGLLTWGALFGARPVVPATAPSALLLQAVAVAAAQIGQLEEPPGSNRGPMVDEFLRCTGVPLGGRRADSRAWCMAFVYWCFAEAARSLGAGNPLPRTAGCLDHWSRGKQVPGAVHLPAAAVAADPSLLKPGLVFIHDFGQGLGHTGIVERLLPGGRLVTIEGNTNTGGSRSGVGVFRLERRKLGDRSLRGFIDYSLAG